MSDAKKEYIVVRKHCLSHKIGQIIKLSEREAKNLTGKVRLKKEFERANEATEGLDEMQKELDAVKATVAGFEADAKENAKQLAVAEKLIKKLRGELAEATK